MSYVSCTGGAGQGGPGVQTPQPERPEIDTNPRRKIHVDSPALVNSINICRPTFCIDLCRTTVIYMFALTPRVTHKILFERVQFTTFLQLLGFCTQTPTRGSAPDPAGGRPSPRPLPKLIS